MSSEQKKQPSLHFLMEFIKDQSLENHAPFEILGSEKEEITTQVTVNVDAGPVAEQTFEISFSTKLEILKKEKALFILELEYAGIVNVEGEPEESSLPFLLFVQGPEMMFPKVRHLVRTATLEASLPPFSLQPIDFVQLLRDKVQKSQTEQDNKGE